MNNTVNISSDGVNVYVHAHVKINPLIKIGITLLSLTLFGLYLVLITHIPHREVKAFIIPVLLMGFLLVYFVARPLLWNLFGSETLIVNTKTISYCYDYGLIRTTLKTVPFHRLGTGYEKERYFGKVEYGKLNFVDYNQETNLPELIHETTVLLPHDQIKEIDAHITEVFQREYFHRMNFIPYSLN